MRLRDMARVLGSLWWLSACHLPGDADEPTTGPDPAATDDGETESDGAVAPPATPTAWFAERLGVSLDEVLWGDMHTHTFYSQDAMLGSLIPGAADEVTPATVYARARNRGLSFSAVADHAEAPVPASMPANETAANVWESTRRMSREADDPVDDADGLFIPFMGYEYTNPYPCTGDGCPGPATCTGLGGNQSCEAFGHKNVVFRSVDGAPSQRGSYLDPAQVSVTSASCLGNRPSPYCGFGRYAVWTYTSEDLSAWLRQGGFGPGPDGRPDALTIVHTPGNIHHVDWASIDPDFVRNVEIYSQWGNSEGSAPERCAVREDIDVDLITSFPNTDEDLVRPRLEQHWRKEGDARFALSFVGGSDDHAGLPGGIGAGHGGLTGVFPSTRTRDGVFDALVDRRTLAATYYASTGPAAVLFGVQAESDALFLGELGETPASGTVTVNVVAAPRIEEIQVVVDGCTVATLAGHEITWEVQGLDPASHHWIYVRARRRTTNQDGTANARPMTAWDQTWASPVYLLPTGGMR